MILITYDLNSPRQNYQRLYDAIKSTGDWWHYLDSTWLVKTHLSVSQVNKRLRRCLDDNDDLLVLEVKPETAAGYLPQEAFDWISDVASSTLR